MFSNLISPTSDKIQKNDHLQATAKCIHSIHINWPKDTTFNYCPLDSEFETPTWTGSICDEVNYSVEIEEDLTANDICRKLIYHWKVTEECLYDPTNPDWNGEGLHEHTQIILIDIESRPILTYCEDLELEPDENCETLLTFKYAAEHEGYVHCPDELASWLILIDLWADGTIDREYSSYVSETDDQWDDSNNNGIPDKYLPRTHYGSIEELVLDDFIYGSLSLHKIEVYAFDACKNRGRCKFDVWIRDKAAPSINLIDSSEIILSLNVYEQTFAKEFDSNSYDNCTDELYYTFDGLKPHITDTIIQNRLLNSSVSHFFNEGGFVDWNGDGGTYPKPKASTLSAFKNEEIQLWHPELNSSSIDFSYRCFYGNASISVFDDFQNTSNDTVYIEFADSQSCCCFFPNTIFGNIYSPDSIPMESGMITLISSLPEGNKLTFTDINGEYVIHHTNENDVRFDIKYLNDVDMKAVNIFDLHLLNRYLLGSTQLDTFQTFTADCNGDMSLSLLDIGIMQDHILGVDITQDSLQWEFVTYHSSQNDAFKWIKDDSLMLNILSHIEIDWIAYLKGDLNFSASYNSKTPSSEPYEPDTIKFITENIRLKAGEEYDIEIMAHSVDNLLGYQFTLTTLGADVISVNTSDDSEYHQHNENSISLLNLQDSVQDITSSLILTLKIRSNHNGFLSDILSLNSDVTESLLFSNGKKYHLDIDFLETSNINNVMSQWDVHLDVNPIQNNLFLDVKLPEIGTVHIELLDLNGSILMSSPVVSNVNELIKVSINSDLKNGMYLCRVTYEGFSKTFKIIKME